VQQPGRQCHVEEHQWVETAFHLTLAHGGVAVAADIAAEKPDLAHFL